MLLGVPVGAQEQDDNRACRDGCNRSCTENKRRAGAATPTRPEVNDGAVIRPCSSLDLDQGTAWLWNSGKGFSTMNSRAVIASFAAEMLPLADAVREFPFSEELAAVPAKGRTARSLATRISCAAGGRGSCGFHPFRTPGSHRKLSNLLIQGTAK